MPSISDFRFVTTVYNPATLSFDLWDGSLTVGSLVIGAVTQSGTWTVQPGNTANTTAWKMDGSAVTQPVSGTFWPATQPISAASLPLPADAATQTTLASLLTELQAKADLGETQPVSLATAPSTPVTGTFWQATQPVSGTVTANPATSFGKTITYVSVNQVAAGTTVLAAASVGNKHKVVAACLVVSLLGTVKFTDDAGDVVGPMDVAANGGFVWPGAALPYTETGATNRALNLVTTLGAARGVVAILTEA